MVAEKQAEVTSPVKEIGKVLRRIRAEREVTLDEAAALTGVSKTMLGQIERGVSSPTISVLWKIAKGLRVSMSNLLSEEDQEYEVVDIEKDIQPVHGADGKMKLYNVFPFNPISGFEYFYITLEPGAVHGSEAHRDAIEEYIVVTEGTLTLELGEQEFELTAPAKISFKADIEHRYMNKGLTNVTFQHIMKY